MAKSRYRIIENHQPYFLTCTVVNWLPIFGSPPVAQIILDSLRFLQAHKRLTLYAYVMVEHHLHLIASSMELAKEIGDFKSYTARQIIDFFEARHADVILTQLKSAKLSAKRDREYQLWQEGSHPQLIQHEEMMRQKIEYIHNNPVKKGYVDDPTHWRYSSARNYAGLAGILDVTKVW